MSIRALLVDDHAVLRAGLRAVLEAQGGIEVVGEAGDVRSAVHQIDALAPDVIVLDLALDGEDGVSALPELLRRAKGGKILVLSSYAQDELVARALRAGATGYAIKTQPTEQLIAAVLEVAAGRRYLAPALSAERIDHYLAADGDEGAVGILTARERQIFVLLARGYSNNQVAQELYISVKTVETHRGHIFRKLGVHSLGDLIRWVSEHDQQDIVQAGLRSDIPILRARVRTP
jgi:two-component system response regulator NreC